MSLDPNRLILTGENPFIRLSETDDGAGRNRADTFASRNRNPFGPSGYPVNGRQNRPHKIRSAPITVIQPTRPGSPKRICGKKRLTAELGGNRTSPNVAAHALISPDLEETA